MAPIATSTSADSDSWGSTNFDTVKRQKLFQYPSRNLTPYPALNRAIEPHVQSFDSLFEGANLLDHALKDIGTKSCWDGGPQELGSESLPLQHGDHTRRPAQLRLRASELYLERSVLPATNKISTRNRDVTPSECRERHTTYRGRLRCKLEYQINGGIWNSSIRELGQMPLMLRSNRCHLQKATPAQLVQAKEESEELGGYFIVNGVEKLIRMLAMPRRNYPMAIIRGSFVKRGASYTKYGIQIRCVRPDQTSQTNVLHYLSDGNVTCRFSWRKNEYLVPVVMILKALVETNDREIFEGLAGPPGSRGAQNTFLTERVELLLRTYKVYNLNGRVNTRAYLGQKFRPVLGVHENTSNYDAGTEFLRRVMLVHLGNVDVTLAQDFDKFKMLLFMIRKLYNLAAGDCAEDNPDAISSQEVLLPGFLYGMILKEKLDEWLTAIQDTLHESIIRVETPRFTNSEFGKYFKTQVLGKVNENVCGSLEYFLSTGNLKSPSGLDLQQVSGFTVIAEKINFYRFISHFRMVHRGSFFAQLKTTAVRKLLPESWGFMCPVHTPDGAPCGLLNHLSHSCVLVTKQIDVSALSPLLIRLGVNELRAPEDPDDLVVQVDGRIIGFCNIKTAHAIARTLRFWKVQGNQSVPRELEIGFIPDSKGGQFPGIYIFSQPSRMIRPVKYLPLDTIDCIGPFEQPFLAVACTQEDIDPHESTHLEVSPTNILSIVANQTPFSDFNQSPRNMYQCQMSKQTMGTPGSSLRFRPDNKLYVLQTGQTPIVRPPLNNKYGLDNFPNGTNAVVAVISYTGYDMDDAMIISKSAHERGFGHGTIYKTKIIRLSDDRPGRSIKGINRFFGIAPGCRVSSEAQRFLDRDGLPQVGSKLQSGDPICASYSVTYDPSHATLDGVPYINYDRETKLHNYQDDEPCFVEDVTLIGSEVGNEPLQAISVKLRIPRSPVIGDKFSSRHGQKGVCSQKWPSADMPFSESGIVPDVIINPHAFPSRMTIGMFVESIAGKSGALHGLAQDSSPWQFSEEDTAAEYFGSQLLTAGFNFHGNEPMYSGITGEEFAADIFVGVVFYQRLRHMVNDKFQVRTTGPVNPLTGQPIKGRSKGGGIRVGEMERDALLAHGCAFLLQDRLLNCSDYRKEWVCKTCGSFISPQATVVYSTDAPKRRGHKGTGVVRCRRCARRLEDVLEQGDDAGIGEEWEDGYGQRFLGGEETTMIPIPGALKYLDIELASMGIRLKYNVDL